MNTTIIQPKLTPLTNHGDHVTCGAAVDGTWVSIILTPHATRYGVDWHAVAWIGGSVVGSSHLTSSAVGAAAEAAQQAAAAIAAVCDGCAVPSYRCLCDSLDEDGLD